jgi:restriction system protein
MPRSAKSRQRLPAKRPSGQRQLRKMTAQLMGSGLFLLALPLVMARLPVPIPVTGLKPIGWALLLLGLGLLAFQVISARRAQARPEQVEETPAPPPVPTAPAAAKVAPKRVPPPPAPIPASPSPPQTDTPPPRPTAWSLDVFNAIEWRRFEALVEALFAQAGFVTRSQSHGADGGVDIWLHSRNQPDGAPVSIVQCKHWQSGQLVGVDKIRELRGVMAANNVRRGQFACTAHYSDAAREFALDNQINLLDGSALLELIAKRTPEQQRALLDVALEGEYWKPTCVNCGTKMVLRTARNRGRQFWGCVNYPRCRSVMSLRQ